MKRTLQFIWLLTHGWFPRKTQYGWRWHRRRVTHTASFNCTLANAILHQREWLSRKAPTDAETL